MRPRTRPPLLTYLLSTRRDARVNAGIPTVAESTASSDSANKLN